MLRWTLACVSALRRAGLLTSAVGRTYLPFEAVLVLCAFALPRLLLLLTDATRVADVLRGTVSTLGALRPRDGLADADDAASLSLHAI